MNAFLLTFHSALASGFGIYGTKDPHKLDAQLLHALGNLEFSQTSTTLNVEQTDALADFFHSTGGEDWIRADGWGAGDPCQSFWFGVSCDLDDHIVAIELANNGLRGSLPESLKYLRWLRILNLHSSREAGPAKNILTGDFPSFVDAVYLSHIDLTGSQISGISADLQHNTNLVALSFSGNLLQSLPGDLQELNRLKIFEFSDNLISSDFPTQSICSLPELYILNVGNNTLTGDFYDECLQSLDPLLFDLSASSLTDGLKSAVPKDLVTHWTNINKGYISFYLQAGLNGHFGQVCTDIRFCRSFNFRSHGDLALVPPEEIPSYVYDGMSLAAKS
jgi:hypothetical protein